MSVSNAAAAAEQARTQLSRLNNELLLKGVVKMDYTIRLNNAGEFSLPSSRVEAMYAPEMYGEIPNAQVKVVGK